MRFQRVLRPCRHGCGARVGARVFEKFQDQWVSTDVSIEDYHVHVRMVTMCSAARGTPCNCAQPTSDWKEHHCTRKTSLTGPSFNTRGWVLCFPSSRAHFTGRAWSGASADALSDRRNLDEVLRHWSIRHGPMNSLAVCGRHCPQRSAHLTLHSVNATSDTKGTTVG